MHKTIISFARTAFFIMLLLVPSLAMADKQAWVEYQEGTAHPHVPQRQAASPHHRYW